MQKVCTSCKFELPVECFSKRAASRDGLQTDCKECHKAYARANHKLNQPQRAEQAKAWKAANAELVRKWGRERQAKRRATQTHEVNAATAARKAYVKRATPSWANKFFIGEAYHLAKLREQIVGGKWHVDHIIPLRGKKVCGLHVENNLQVIPAPLNVRKHATFTVA